MHTVHGPVGAAAWNQIPSRQHTYVAPTWKTTSWLFCATETPSAPGIGANFGAPSNVTTIVVFDGSTVAVRGIDAISRASSACAVPGTEARTFAFGLSTGIFAKSAGSVLVAAAHGPAKPGEANQRPASRR